MQCTRTIAIGLLIAAYLIIALAKAFTQWAKDLAWLTYSYTIESFSPIQANLLGTSSILPAAFIIACLGAGILISYGATKLTHRFLPKLFRLLKRKRSLNDALSSRLLAPSKQPGA